MKLILLNGPPRSGKDTLGHEVVRLLNCAGRSAGVYKFANALKLMTHRTFGVFNHADWFEKVKDEPNESFFGKTPRQVYIAMSETFLKPLYGKAIFGKLLADQLRGDSPEVVVVTDSGFVEEAICLIDELQPEDVILVHMVRDGFDFSNDSRSYVHLPGTPAYRVNLGPGLCMLSGMADGLLQRLVK